MARRIAFSVEKLCGDGEIRLDVIDRDSVVDAVGNPLGGTGAGNGGFAAGEIYIIDRTSPTLLAIQLRDDDGANTPSVGFTNGQTVDVTLLAVAGDPTEMWLSESSTFTSGGWVAFQNPTSYTFTTAVEGIKTVYVQLRDAVDNRTGGAGDIRTSITLDTTPPQVNPTAATPFGTWPPPTIAVSYDEIVTWGALDPDNYAIAGTSTPAVLSVATSGTLYVLETEEQVVDDPYTVTVSNVVDRAGNPIDPANDEATWLGVPVEVTRFDLE